MKRKPHLKNTLGSLGYEIEYKLVKYSLRSYHQSSYKENIEHYSFNNRRNVLCETWAEATIKDGEYRLKGLPIKLRQ